MTASPAAHDIHQTGTCPPWCTSSPHRSFGEICESASPAVPTASPVHVCGYYEAHEDDCPCPGTISATLCAYQTEVWVSVGHGDDRLPPMTVDGAEHLARDILALVAAARTA